MTARFDPAEGLEQIVANEDFAFVSTPPAAPRSILVVDIRNRMFPELTASLDGLGHVQGMALEGVRLYVVTEAFPPTLQLYDVSDPASPAFVNELSLPVKGNALAVRVC